MAAYIRRGQFIFLVLCLVARMLGYSDTKNRACSSLCPCKDGQYGFADGSAFYNTRGEQTASSLEANLTSLENKLDEILAALGVSAADLEALDEQEKGPRGNQSGESENGASKAT